MEHSPADWLEKIQQSPTCNLFWPTWELHRCTGPQIPKSFCRSEDDAPKCVQDSNPFAAFQKSPCDLMNLPILLFRNIPIIPHPMIQCLECTKLPSLWVLWDVQAISMLSTRPRVVKCKVRYPPDHSSVGCGEHGFVYPCKAK